jgi:EAL domain-containing protein (putative c-di-GMP-specific phosphodiesterase class I)
VGRVIELAHDLGLRVVAEGVESTEERDFLAGHGCDLLQGYLISPPMSASDLLATLTRPPVPSGEVA